MTNDSRNIATSPGLSVLITGGAGFFGSLLTKRLLGEGQHCVIIDLETPDFQHERLTAINGDICDRVFLEGIFQSYDFDTVYHCAAILSHAVKDKAFLWQSNVDGTRNVMDSSAAANVQSVIFISSNCLWAHNLGRPVKEEDQPAPVEIYGKSKWEGELIVRQYQKKLNTVIIRCPTIIDEGRLGLLAILFEFISEGRRVWVVGGGTNRYQFVYAQDLASACITAARSGRSDLFNIGSDDVGSFRETYQYVIDKANTGARIRSLPRRLTLAAMRIAHALGISPLGPYQYRMIAEDFVFDTSHIKKQIQWRPTLSNAEMLWRAYNYYNQNRPEIESRKAVSAHRQVAKMGVIRILKWIS